jgi:hypothetical protein
MYLGKSEVTLMAKTIPIDPADRVQQRIMARDEAESTEELIGCTNALASCLENLAMRYPGSIGIGASVAGKAWGIMVLSAEADGEVCSRIAPERMRTWAQLIANLSDELLAGQKAASG